MALEWKQTSEHARLRSLYSTNEEVKLLIKVMVAVKEC